MLATGHGPVALPRDMQPPFPQCAIKSLRHALYHTPAFGRRYNSMNNLGLSQPVNCARQRAVPLPRGRRQRILQNGIHESTRHQSILFS